MNIRVSEEEKKMYQEMAEFFGMNLSEFVRYTLNEAIEDYIDARDAERLYKEYLEDGKKARPIEELWAELKL